MRGARRTGGYLLINLLHRGGAGRERIFSSLLRCHLPEVPLSNSEGEGRGVGVGVENFAF